MKDKITGYITGAINNHIRIVETMKKYKYQNQLIQLHENCITELSDLLDYAIDIPVEGKELVTDTYVEINRLRDILAKKEVRSEDLALEIIMLRQRVAELEESCENMCEVEKNLHKKIKRLEAAEISYREQFLDDKQKIEEVENEKNEFWECNKQLNQLYKENRNKNEILQTQNKKLKYDNKKLHKKIEILRKKSNGPIRKNV